MAEDSMALLETLRKATADGDVDVLREGVRVLAQAIMEAEVTELTGVPQGRARPGAPPDPPQRVPRPALGHPGGHRSSSRSRGSATARTSRPCSSRAGGPSGPCWRSIQEAYVLGVSTRRVDDLVRTLGIASISKSEVSRICAALDAEVAAFRGRSLAGEAYPYLWLDATYLKVREGGRVVSMAALVATGVARSGERRILGLELAPGNDEGSRLAGLHPRRSSSAASTASASSSATTTRASSRPSGSSSSDRAGSAAGSTSPATPRTSSRARRGAWSPRPSGRSSSSPTRPRPATSAAGSSPCSSRASRPSPGCSPTPSPTSSPTSRSPSCTARRIRSTNPLERLNKEIKRRTAVVGIFPNRAAVIRLVGMILAEQDDEWQDGRRYFRPESMVLIDAVAEPEEVGPPLLIAS